MAELALTAAEVEAYLAEVFPQQAGRFRITGLAPAHLICAMAMTEQDLRPGQTISGPAMFACADCAFYMLTLAHVGRQALTVTTSCTINFMRKPVLGDLRAEARLLKLGRALAVGDVLLFGQGQESPVAQASLTYSIPPR